MDEEELINAEYSSHDAKKKKKKNHHCLYPFIPLQVTLSNPILSLFTDRNLFPSITQSLHRSVSPIHSSVSLQVVVSSHPSLSPSPGHSLFPSITVPLQVSLSNPFFSLSPGHSLFPSITQSFWSQSPFHNSVPLQVAVSSLPSLSPFTGQSLQSIPQSLSRSQSLPIHHPVPLQVTVSPIHFSVPLQVTVSSHPSRSSSPGHSIFPRIPHSTPPPGCSLFPFIPWYFF